METVTTVLMLMILLASVLGVITAIVGVVLLAITRKQTKKHTVGMILMIVGFLVAAVFAVLLGVMGTVQYIAEKDPFTGFETLIPDPPIVDEDSDYHRDTDYGEVPLKDGWYQAGGYEVGKDIPAGEYYVKADENTFYSDIIRKASERSDSFILYDSCDTFRFVTVEEGEYFETVNCTFISSAFVEPFPAPEDGIYYSGEYRVGIDLPAGEYAVLPDGRNVYPRVECDTSSTHVYENRIFSHNINGSHVYISVKEGEYLLLDDAKLMPIEQAPKVKPDQEGRYPVGMYRIGTDLPAGSYFVMPYENEDSLFFEVYTDLRSEFCDYNEFSETFTYVVLEEGTVTTDRCYLIPTDKAPIPPIDGDSYGPGCYLVGKDIPAGEYVISAKRSSSYPNYGITDKPQGSITRCRESEYLSIISKKTVTVAEGEYLMVEDASFEKK